MNVPDKIQINKIFNIHPNYINSYQILRNVHNKFSYAERPINRKAKRIYKTNTYL